MSRDLRLSPSRPVRAIVVVQPSASHYRAPLMTRLLESPSVEVRLLGKRSFNSANPPDEVIGASGGVMSRVEPFTDLKLIGSFRWQVGIFKRALSANADVMVLEGNPYVISTWFALMILRLRRRKAVLWGHGWKRSDRPLKLAFRKAFYRCASGHLLYGDWARQYAERVGLNANSFYPVYNSIYSEAILNSRFGQSSSIALSASDSIALIFSGRLTARHEVELAVEAVVRLRQQGLQVSLTVVGDGPESAALAGLSSGHGAAVKMLGAVYDFERLSDLYHEADFAVSPGASGLNVIQAMSFGVPVIAAEGHHDSGPEVEAVIDQRTGLLFEAGSAESLVEAIRRAKKLPAERYAQQVSEARALVYARYTAERHAESMLSALQNIVQGGPVA